MEIQEVSGHLILETASGRYVVDTGSPTSFARGGNINFASRTVEVSTSAMGMLDADTLSGYIGSEVDGLIGMDVLGDYRLTFSQNRLIVEDSDNLEDGFVALPTDSFMGIPVVAGNIDGHEIRVFVDSGAKISYLSPNLIANLPIAENVRDFYPGMGEFDVDVSIASCTLAGLPLQARFGRLPTLLQMTLMMGGVNGILGNDLFSKYDVCINHGQQVAIRQQV